MVNTFISTRSFEPRVAKKWEVICNLLGSISLDAISENEICVYDAHVIDTEMDFGKTFASLYDLVESCLSVLLASLKV